MLSTEDEEAQSLMEFVIEIDATALPYKTVML